MTILLLSSSSSDALKNLISTGSKSQSSSSSHNSLLPKQLLDELTSSITPKFDLDSPAVPSDQSSVIDSSQKCRVDSKLLIQVASWARSGLIGRDQTKDPTTLSLNSLLKNAQVYHAPKPVRIRSPEFEAQLTAIRLEQERIQYEEMLLPRLSTNQSNSPFNLSSLKSNFSSNSTPGTGRYGDGGGGALPAHLKLTPEQEMKEWNEVKKQLSAIVNVLLSMAATGTAGWWALGNTGIATKTVTSLLLSFLIGIAEVALYSRHWSNVQEKNQISKSKPKKISDSNTFNFPESMNINRFEDLNQERKVWDSGPVKHRVGSDKSVVDQVDDGRDNNDSSLGMKLKF